MKIETITENELLEFETTVGMSPVNNELTIKKIAYRGEFITFIYLPDIGWSYLKSFRSLAKAMSDAKETITESQDDRTESKGNTMTENQITINDNNRFILDEELDKMTDGELYLLASSDENTCDDKLCEIYRMLDEKSKDYFVQILEQQFNQRGLQDLDVTKSLHQKNKSLNRNAKGQNIQEDFISDEIDIDTKTAILEAIKQTNINEVSLFKRSTMLNKLEETTHISRDKIERYLDQKEIIQESKSFNNEYFTKVSQALQIIKPVEYPKINRDMSESAINQVIQQNDDWLLESKLKTYLSAKKNEYKKLDSAEKSIRIEKFKDPILEMNKFQRKISETNNKYTYDEQLQIAEQMEQGYETYLSIKEAYDITPPRDSSLLSLYINFAELSEKAEVKDLYQKAEAYLEEMARGTGKDIQHKSIFEYQSIIKNDIQEKANNQSTSELYWLGDYAIALEEKKDYFGFNILAQPYYQDRTKSAEEINEQMSVNFKADLQKAKRTLEKKMSNKKFTPATEKEQELESVSFFDTNKFRVHLLDPKEDKNIRYTIEYYPNNYDPKMNTLDLQEQFYESLQESMTAKKLEQYLLSGEFVELPTGEILWYSNSDKVFMIDMEKIKWLDLYNQYKQADRNKISEVFTTELQTPSSRRVFNKMKKKINELSSSIGDKDSEVEMFTVDNTLYQRVNNEFYQQTFKDDESAWSFLSKIA